MHDRMMYHPTVNNNTTIAVTLYHMETGVDFLREGDETVVDSEEDIEVVETIIVVEVVTEVDSEEVVVVTNSNVI
jgi:hypothetical protein